MISRPLQVTKISLKYVSQLSFSYDSDLHSLRRSLTKKSPPTQRTPDLQVAKRSVSGSFSGPGTYVCHRLVPWRRYCTINVWRFKPGRKLNDRSVSTANT